MSTRPARCVRAVVLGGDARVRHALAGLLVAGARIRVVEEATDAAETEATIARACPDVVVVDLDGGDADDWLGVIAAVRSRCPGAAVIAMARDSTADARVLAAGADAFVGKLASALTTCEAIERAIGRRQAARAEAAARIGRSRIAGPVSPSSGSHLDLGAPRHGRDDRTETG